MTTTTDSFQPAYGSGVTVAPTGTSASSTFTVVSSESVVLTNLDSVLTVYVRVGEGAQTATLADYPVLPNTQVSLSKARYENTVAYRTSSGTGSLHIIPGRGL
jgi:hypothetical protein